MAFKLVVLSALLAAANAGIVGAPLGYAASPYGYAGYASPHHATAIGSQTQSVVRSADGNSAISTYSKAVDTAYSSVRKYDTRVSNDAIAYPGAIAHGYAAPAIAHGYAAPAIAHGYAAPAIAHGYAAPAIAHGYAAPAYASAAYAPALGARAYAPAVAAHGGLLGVAYSAAPAVAHISYSNPIVSYAY